MRLPSRDQDPPSIPESRPVRWLRLAKLLLTVVLLAIAVWRAFSGALPW